MKDTALQPLVFEQIKAIALTLVLAVVGTTVIAFVLKFAMGLRPTEDVEVSGLDVSEHGEEGYHSEAYSSGRSSHDAEAAIPAPLAVNRKAATT